MRRSAAMLPLEVKTVMGATDERQQPLLYAVNIGQQQGYVVVSGDDRLRPVLAYSDKGTYSDEAVPANMRVWLEGYVREMQWLSQHGCTVLLLLPDISGRILRGRLCGYGHGAGCQLPCPA